MGLAHNSGYVDNFTYLSDIEIKKIRETYKVIDVPLLYTEEVRYQMFGDKYFENNPEKEKIVDDMLDYYLKNKCREIYRKTDFLCNEKEKICICSKHAEDLRRIYDEKNYKPGVKFISWIKKETDHF
jgi:hypothetical protein